MWKIDRFKGLVLWVFFECSLRVVWVISEWLLGDLWVIYDWSLSDFWLISESSPSIFWVYFVFYFAWKCWGSRATHVTISCWPRALPAGRLAPSQILLTPSTSIATPCIEMMNQWQKSQPQFIGQVWRTVSLFRWWLRRQQPSHWLMGRSTQSSLQRSFPISSSSSPSLTWSRHCWFAGSWKHSYQHILFLQVVEGGWGEAFLVGQAEATIWGRAWADASPGPRPRKAAGAWVPEFEPLWIYRAQLHQSHWSSKVCCWPLPHASWILDCWSCSTSLTSWHELQQCLSNLKGLTWLSVLSSENMSMHRLNFGDWKLNQPNYSFEYICPSAPSPPPNKYFHISRPRN